MLSIECTAQPALMKIHICDVINKLQSEFAYFFSDGKPFFQLWMELLDTGDDRSNIHFKENRSMAGPRFL